MKGKVYYLNEENPKDVKIVDIDVEDRDNYVPPSLEGYSLLNWTIENTKVGLYED